MIASSAGLFGQPLAAHYGGRQGRRVRLDERASRSRAQRTGSSPTWCCRSASHGWCGRRTGSPDADEESFIGAIQPELVVPIVTYPREPCVHVHATATTPPARVASPVSSPDSARAGSRHAGREPTADDVDAHIEEVSATEPFTVPMSIVDEVIAICATGSCDQGCERLTADRRRRLRRGAGRSRRRRSRARRGSHGVCSPSSQNDGARLGVSERPEHRRVPPVRAAEARVLGLRHHLDRLRLRVLVEEREVRHRVGDARSRRRPRAGWSPSPAPSGSGRAVQHRLELGAVLGARVSWSRSVGSRARSSRPATSQRRANASSSSAASTPSADRGSRRRGALSGVRRWRRTRRARCVAPVAELAAIDRRTRRLALVRERVLAVQVEVRHDHRRLDVLPLAGAMAREEPEHHRRRVAGRGHGVGAALAQRRVALAGLVRGLPRERGDHRVDRRLPRVRADRAVRRRVVVDEPRVDRAERLVVDAERLGDAGRGSCARRRRHRPRADAGSPCPRSSFRLSAIDSLPCIARTMLLWPSVGDRVAAAAAEQAVRVAVHRLDLDDARAELGEQRGRERRRVVVGRLDDRDAVERSGELGRASARGSGDGCRPRSARTSSVCSPGSGAGPRTSAGAPEIFASGPTWSMRPTRGSSSSTVTPSAATCRCRSASCVVWMTSAHTLPFAR